MNPRKAILERVRRAVVSGQAHRPGIRFKVGQDVGYAGAGADLLGRLAAELKAVGAHPVRVNGMESGIETIREISRGARLAIRWSCPLLDRSGLDSALAENGTEVVPWSDVERLQTTDPVKARDLIFGADLGISCVDGAAAETGTIALGSSPGQGPPVSLLPPTHIALVEAYQVVPDLFDLLKIFESSSGNLPGNLVLVTGPSKTGDIELRLTTGVHGPGDLHVIILEDGV